jgi:hypothetical protein
LELGPHGPFLKTILETKRLALYKMAEHISVHSNYAHCMHAAVYAPRMRSPHFRSLFPSLPQ